ncbi:unnamed protein product [Onchocerca ochengi]|uniref:SET domain-containing protein n=1 Tax=Onchocerca ochengi TaxID=42157 RepID=A0A182EBT5_ONCOC|nr:unnamed protein product [Onchocerca ochengi]
MQNRGQEDRRQDMGRKEKRKDRGERNHEGMRKLNAWLAVTAAASAAVASCDFRAYFNDNDNDDDNSDGNNNNSSNNFNNNNNNNHHHHHHDNDDRIVGRRKEEMYLWAYYGTDDDEKVRCDTMMFELAMDNNSVCPKTSSNVPMGKKEKERRARGMGKNLLEEVPVEIYSKSYLKTFAQDLKQLLF